MRGYKLADITDVQDFRERFDRWPIIVGMKRGGFVVSPDGLVRGCYLASNRL